ncbi:MAG: dihydrodipicolinate reductase [Acidobacteria bacterium]|nr:dihydrodipicolinate reductase [Acidobacteriota bacterium]
MHHRVVVWGTGNVGQPAMRTVLAVDGLELVGAIVSQPNKVGRDIGELAGVAPVGITTTDGSNAKAVDALLAQSDAVVYTASGDLRPDDAVDDVERCLRAGANVVSTSVYGLLHPKTVPTALAGRIGAACREGNVSVFVSGIDPGWAQDILPLLLTRAAGRIDAIRIQEIFDYASYHAPDAVRNLVGFGMPIDSRPPMLIDTVPTSIWGPSLRTMADGLDIVLDEIVEHVELLPLSADIDVPTMGTFEAGTIGAMRFEVQGIVDGAPFLVVEHVTRIGTEFGPDAAPDWPQPPANKTGCHRVIIEGQPKLTVTVEADDGTGNPAEGGNATAAARIVRAIPAVIAAQPGVLSPLNV